MNQSSKQIEVPFALKNFDSLPDAAEVSIKVVKVLYGFSNATIYRGVKSGKIPAPTKHTAGCSRWNVGKLRKALSEGS